MTEICIQFLMVDARMSRFAGAFAVNARDLAQNLLGAQAQAVLEAVVALLQNIPACADDTQASFLNHAIARFANIGKSQSIISGKGGTGSGLFPRFPLVPP